MAFPRFTENTVRNLLLRELEKRGVKAATEVTYRTPVGLMKPDALLQDGGSYVVETKLGAEAKLFDAMTTLYDYTKHAQVVGGFAILLPGELRRPVPIEWLERLALAPDQRYVATAIFKDKRTSQRFTGSLSELADWVSRHVLRPPEYVEPDTSLAIRVLNDAVDYITLSTLQMGEEELEDIFGGKTVFENILQYEAGRYPLEEMRRAATYLLINQILFYHVLSSRDPIVFPEIREDFLKKPGDLAIYFKRVLEVDYTSTFGFDVASRLPPGAVEVVVRIVKAVKALAPEKIKYDLLGKVFHDLIPFETRKAVAAFYTNNEAAELLAQLSIDGSDAKVMDLACGSGTLLVAAYHRKRELLEESGGYFGLEEHRRFLEEDLTGIDIMPFAAHLAVVHLSLQSPVYETEKVRVAVWDSTELEPGQTIPAIHKELREAYKRPPLDAFLKGKPSFEEEAYVKKGAVTAEGVGGEAIGLEEADVVIMNPPFTRQERLPKEYKNALDDRLKNYKDKLHGQLGLYGYFIFLADSFLKQGGRLALVLPATVLRISSTQGVRDLLVNNYEFEHIITTYQRAAFSEGAQFREILLVARKTSNITEQPCMITFLKTLPKDAVAARELAGRMKALKNKLEVGEIYDSINLSVRNIRQQELRANLKNIFKFIACEDLRLPEIWNKVQERAKETFADFSESLLKLGAKIEEGARARSHLLRAPIGSMYILFSKSRASKRVDRWVLKNVTRRVLTAENLIDKRTLNIPLKSLQYGLRRLSGINSIDLSNKLDYVLVKEFPRIEDFFLTEKIDHILSDLPKWREYLNRRFSKMAVAFRFDMSAKGTTLFAWYSAIPMIGCGVVWNITGLRDDDAKILTLWFNSTINALQIFLNRVETRGAWMQFHKYVMEDLLVPDPSRLSKHQREVILQTFEDVKDLEFPSFLDQLEYGHPARKEIDEAILKILGFEEDEIKKLLDYLYPALHREILRLKELMAG